MVIDAIFENGVIRPLAKLEITDRTRLRVTIESVPGPEQAVDNEELDDPFEGLSVKTGIRDLADNFDDYRFGRRMP